ncbi:MAG: hypothetical protein WEB13_04835 [Dehalococcoidia bacterium]
MPRRPNYSYERMQRDRAKAEKREAKATAKAAEKARLANPGGEEPQAAGDGVEGADAREPAVEQ